MDSQELKQARLDKKLLSNVSKMPGYSISRRCVAVRRRQQACRDRRQHMRELLRPQGHVSDAERPQEDDRTRRIF